MTQPTAADLDAFAAGRHRRLWEALGARPGADGAGTSFAVWAPHARQVAVIGSWDGWTASAPLVAVGQGVWSGSVAGVAPGDLYKFRVTGSDGEVRDRADPMAAYAEGGGGWASVVFASAHRWGDDAWMAERRRLDPLRGRLSVYEVHLGSWRRHPDGGWLTYRELAPRLADHVTGLGFTHVELLPVAEHPYDPSWGYQTTGYFAPTWRFGDPDDFRWFVDHLHQRGVGVIVDWVPAHFPRDGWALARFDGEPCYEPADPRRADHPDWGTLEFDHGRPEVRAFLLSSAAYWVDELHVDGLRVDAVASMLYLDYSRPPGGWEPNELGGREDLHAVAFLRELNTSLHDIDPGVLVIAEESTTWDGVTRPVADGGLGFTHKWNMGWMHDTLGYWATDPHRRPGESAKLTFGLTYAWAEHFVLPLSHDEVVHEKRPLVGKMPGVGDERLAHLRALYAWMWAHPGAPLLFMGGELAETQEWSQDRALAWDLLDDPDHAGLTVLLAELNRLQAAHPALFAADVTRQSFSWLDPDRDRRATFAFERRLEDDVVVCVANLGAIPQTGYRVALRGEGAWKVVLRTDDARFGGPLGGDQAGVAARVVAEPAAGPDRGREAPLDLPPVTVQYLVPV